MENLKLGIRQFVIDNFLFGENADGLSDEESLLERGIIDSTGILELVGFLQETFGINVEDFELVPDNLDSIVRITRFVQLKTEVRGQSAAGPSSTNTGHREVAR